MSPCCFRARWRHSPWRSVRFRLNRKLWNQPRSARFRLNRKLRNPPLDARFRLNPRWESLFRLHPLHSPRLLVSLFRRFLLFLLFRRFLPCSLCRPLRLCRARATAIGFGG